MTNTPILSQIHQTADRLAEIPVGYHGHGIEAGLLKLQTLAQLDALVEDAKFRYVAMARGRDQFSPADQRPATWQEIGDALGITKQAAQQRYGKAL